MIRCYFYSPPPPDKRLGMKMRLFASKTHIWHHVQCPMYEIESHSVPNKTPLPHSIIAYSTKAEADDESLEKGATWSSHSLMLLARAQRARY